MLTKAQQNLAEEELKAYLLSYYGVSISEATNKQLYLALAKVTNAILFAKRGKIMNEKNREKKVVHYMSIEFLLGRSLRNNLWNLGLEETFKELLNKSGKNISEVYDEEQDAGLGNGGLGRLAACYLDSLATLGYSAVGHTIKYEYGLFKQKIKDGKQVEDSDRWLDTGDVWLNKREDQTVEVSIGGKLIQHYDESKGLYYEAVEETKVRAIPYDMLISGYNSNTSSVLRLWEAKAEEDMDLRLFNMGEHESALKNDALVNRINKILYPADNNENGKVLRLIQEYFLVSASMQNILNNYFAQHDSLSSFPELLSVHINDTHCAFCIAELMRLLIDKYNFGWEASWNAIKKTISYTNHTILSEALEVKNMIRIEKYMPRIALILRELDRRFRIELGEFFKNDSKKIEELSIVSGNNVYMANLSIYASHNINGVAEIHSQILQTRLFKDYAILYPMRFKNVTNGVTHRRWLSQSNPLLSDYIKSLIGDGFYEDATKLEKLKEFENDENVLNKIAEIKFQNKQRLADYILKTQGIEIDPNARFDIQVKRIHEYKRQLLNVLKIIYLMCQIRENPTEEVTPQVFIFAGKAASSYKVAKRIIELINHLAKEIDEDPQLSGKIKVVFLENYSVTMSELLMPATEVSEQISLAGREASGTGNMKAVLNGGLMLCTIDGANIEICDHCGHENMFEFGLTAEEAEKIKSRGYNAMEYYIGNENIRKVIDKLGSGIGGERFDDIVDYLLGHSANRDVYLCLADFDAYIEAHFKMDKVYKDKSEWNKRSLHSIASMGYFASDRSVQEYVEKIWHLAKNEE